MALDYIQRYKTIKNILDTDVLRILRITEWCRNDMLSLIFTFNNLIDECWKLMRDLLGGPLGFTEEDLHGGPKDIIRMSYEHGVIQSDRWLKMWSDRNAMTHDYINQDVQWYCDSIKNEYIILVNGLLEYTEKYVNKDD